MPSRRLRYLHDAGNTTAFHSCCPYPNLHALPSRCTCRLQSTFADERGRLADELDAARRAVAEWEGKYSSRESRPDDVLRIRKLTQLVKVRQRPMAGPK